VSVAFVFAELYIERNISENRKPVFEIYVSRLLIGKKETAWLMFTLSRCPPFICAARSSTNFNFHNAWIWQCFTPNLQS
jgi:hypothetical protein